MKNRVGRLAVLAFLSLAGCYGGPEDEASASQAASDPPPQLDPCVWLPHRPDLVLDSLSVVNQGGSAHMLVTLRNRGCAASPGIGQVFSVTLLGGSQLFATWAPNSSYGSPANGIPRGATQTFDWNLYQSLASVQGLGGHWHLVIDPNNTITELNENNNAADVSNP